MSYVRRHAAFELARPIAEVFHLFTPEGEKLWAPGWDFQNVMGESALAEDYVFLTKSHDHAGAPAIWLVKRFDPDAGLVQYYRVEPGDKVGVVSVHCTALEATGTRVSVEYGYLPLSEHGRQFVDQFSDSAFVEFIGQWETQLNAYFAEGA